MHFMCNRNWVQTNMRLQVKMDCPHCKNWRWGRNTIWIWSFMTIACNFAHDQKYFQILVPCTVSVVLPHTTNTNTTYKDPASAAMASCFWDNKNMVSFIMYIPVCIHLKKFKFNLFKETQSLRCNLSWPNYSFSIAKILVHHWERNI